MSIYYYTQTTTIQTPENETLDERWDIINDVPTKSSTSFQPCPAFVEFQPYHDIKSQDDLIIQQYSPPSSDDDDISQDYISSYFREEMENSENLKIIIEEPEEDMENNKLMMEEIEYDEDDEGVTETIPLEQVTPTLLLQDIKCTAPQNILDYHRSLVKYYQSCIKKLNDENELIDDIQNLAIL